MLATQRQIRQKQNRRRRRGLGALFESDAQYLEAYAMMLAARDVPSADPAFLNARKNMENVVETMQAGNPNFFLADGTISPGGRQTITSAIALLRPYLTAPPQQPPVQLLPSQIDPDGAAFVRSLYLGYLGREPEQGGIDFWTQKLIEGHTRASVEDAFATSQEYLDRIAAQTPPPTIETPLPTKNGDGGSQSPLPTTTGPTNETGTTNETETGAEPDVLATLKETWAGISTPVKIGGAIVLGLMLFGGSSGGKRR